MREMTPGEWLPSSKRETCAGLCCWDCLEVIPARWDVRSSVIAKPKSMLPFEAQLQRQRGLRFAGCVSN